MGSWPATALSSPASSSPANDRPAGRPGSGRLIGTSCAGKTTFARRLARALASPHVELDALYWGPNWTLPAPEAFRRRVEAAAAGERWVIDGNYSVAREVIWARATAVVWLNYALARVAWRAVRRTVGRALSGEELYAGNRESLRTAFLSRDSIIWWAVSTFGSRRRRYRALFDSRDFPHLTMIELHRPADADAFWRRVEAGCRNTLDGE